MRAAALMSALAAAPMLAGAPAAAQEPQPEPLASVRPEYPPEAQPYRIPAECRARFDLTPNGAPTNVCVKCAAAAVPEAFEREAAKALHAWRYPPERRYGPRMRREDLTVEIPFVLRAPPWSLSRGEPAPAPSCGPGEIS